MKTIVSIILMPFFLNSSNQIELKGTYEGTLGGTKVVANMRTTNGIVLGSIYESKEKYHRFRGVISNDSIDGVLFFHLLADIPYKGLITEKGKKVEITTFLLAEDSTYQHIELSLHKISNSTEINYDKHFPQRKVAFKKEYDSALVGEWKLIKEVLNDGKETSIGTDRSVTMTFYANGTVNMFMPKYANTKAMSQLKIEWYTSEKVLYLKMSHRVIESIEGVHDEKYEIRGDTLITQNVKGQLHIHIKQ